MKILFKQKGLQVQCLDVRVEIYNQDGV
jgi:hypothetical protein